MLWVYTASCPSALKGRSYFRHHQDFSCAYVSCDNVNHLMSVGRVMQVTGVQRMPGMSSDLPKCVIVDCTSRKVNRGYCGNLVPIWVRCCTRETDTWNLSCVHTARWETACLCLDNSHTAPQLFPWRSRVSNCTALCVCCQLMHA